MNDLPVPHPTPGDHDAEAVVVLREEQLRVGTERRATERVRLERFVVTEQRTITVDVRREEVRLVREPIPDSPLHSLEDDAPARGPIVVVLREEQVVVTKQVVPVERVTLTVHTVTEDHAVDGVLRHEEVTVDPGPGRSADPRA